MGALTSIFSPLGGRFGVQLVTTSATVGTIGGTPVVASSTASLIIPVPFRKCKLLSLAIVGQVAGVAAGTMTVQAFRRANAGTPADKTLTATANLLTLFATLTKAYNVAITASETDSIFQTGDALRVDMVASSTISTQPQCTIVATFAVMN